MQTIINFLAGIFGKVRMLFKKAIIFFAAPAQKCASFVLPQDEVEKLEVLRSAYKTLSIIISLLALFAGVWLADHDHPSCPVLLLFALRLLYILPAKRVDHALRKHQVQDRASVMKRRT